MSLKDIIKGLDLTIDKSESEVMDKEVKNFISNLSGLLKKKRIKADVFVGGSFAKKTMIKSSSYDVDVFIRFHKDGEISDTIEAALKDSGLKYIRVHGSRDYFQIQLNREVTFEVIPIIKIKNPKEAKNVTDLSYFHVNYVRKKMNNRIANEIRIAKQFCKACGVYGAESYIGGISGYGVECLVIYYKSFENMAKSIVKSKDKIIIDPEKRYKGKDVLIELNESKLESPIVLIDPTFKERNVLAALRTESFNKFKKALEEVLKKPNKSMFEIKEMDIKSLENKAKKVNAEFVKISLITDRQDGDIAGTKMKKFSEFFVEDIANYFEVVEKNYVYGGSKEAELYLIVRPKRDIVKRGPPLSLIEHAKAFRLEHKSNFIKAGILYAKVEGYKKFLDFFKDWKIKNNNKIKEMDITGIEIR